MRTFDCATSPLEGTHLLEASAGTGKTYTIADLYLRLVKEKGLAVDRILVVTFTVAATEELKDRLRGRLKDALTEAEAAEGAASGKKKKETAGLVLRRLRRALADFDTASVYTIHGFCQRALLENAFESGSLFDTKLVTDATPLVRQAAEDFWRSRFYDGRPALLRYALRSLTLERLISLAGKAAANPVLALLPESAEADEAGLEAAIVRAEETYREAAVLWTKEGAAIGEEYAALVADGVIKGVHQARHVETRLGSVRSYFAGGDPFAECKQLLYFTSGSLRDGAKGCNVSGRRFYDVCDLLWGALQEAAEGFDRYAIKMKRECVEFVLRETEARRREMNLRTFGDLLTAMRSALQGPSGDALRAAARRKFPAALIDEFQDTDSIQYDIFRSIFDYPGGLLYLVGDPKQSIYRFRGADIFTYMQAARSAGSRATLGTNWRSVPELVTAVNALFGHMKNPFVFDEDLIGFPGVKAADRKADRFECSDLDPAPLQVWYLGDCHIPQGSGAKAIPAGDAEALIAAAVAGEIAGLAVLGLEKKAFLAGREVTPGDMAVLVRRHDQAELMRRELRRLGIPSVVYGTASVFASAEAVELSRVLKAAADFGSDALIKSALATDIFGRSANDIDAMSGDGGRWEGTVLRFARYRETWTERGFLAMFRLMLAEEDVYARILPLPDGERRMTNLLHLAELLHRRESEANPSREGLLLWFAESMEEAGDAEETQMRLETDENAVKIMTLHASKGLQFPVVFCPFLSRGVKVDAADFTFHRGDGLALELGSDEAEEHRQQAKLEELAESVRLFYVGITRAMSRCYIAWGRINQSDTSAPAWVFHRPEVAPGDNPVERLKERMKGQSEKEMLAELASLEERSGGTVRVIPLPAGAGARAFRERRGKMKTLTCAEFTAAIDAGWSVASYSSLASSGRRDDGADRDEARVPVPAGARAEGFDDIAWFPAGPAAGSCLHEILEKIEFTRFEESAAAAVISDALARGGFDPRWKDAVSELVRRVMTTPLGPGIALGEVGPADRIAELEFYYPLARITPQGLAGCFSRAAATAGDGRTGEGLEFSPRRGFMRGFIDLVFRREGRYYIVDWKSNRLGDRAAQYDAAAMGREMALHNYHLQYHIYAVALHRYLQARMEGYRIGEHFGGVYYLFLRGVDPAGAPGQGIFFHRPEDRTIEGLSRYFLEGDR